MEINKHTLPITITKAQEVQFLLRLHHTLANATHVLLANTNWQMLKNMKDKPNNTHIPYYIHKCT